MFLIDNNHYFKRFKKPINETINHSLTLPKLLQSRKEIAQQNGYEFLILDATSTDHIELKADNVILLITDNKNLHISGRFKSLIIEDISTYKYENINEKNITVHNYSPSKIVFINNNQTSLCVTKNITINNYSSLNLFIYTHKNDTFTKNNLLINMFEQSEIKSLVFIESSDKQVYDLTAEIVHKKEKTKSSIDFIALNQGKTVSQINSVVEKNNLNCELNQHIKHILFNETAVSYSKPSLMISAPCTASHGNSIGSIPDDWLFYLQSKGLTQQQSLEIIRKSIKNKFIDDIDIPLFNNGDFI